MVRDLTKGSPLRVILTYSLPIIIGNVFQQLYNVVDSVILGSCVNYQALAAVGVTNSLIFFVLGFVLGITGGLGIRIAHFFGSGDERQLRRSVAVSLLIALGSALLLTVTALLFVHPLLRLIDTPPSLFDDARRYITIVFLGLTAQMAYNMVACILRALGDSRVPLYFLIFSSLLNVVLDLLFVVHFGWGVAGAAWATVAAQALSAICCFAYAFQRYPMLRLHRDDFKADGAWIWHHLQLGLPMALQFSITAVGLFLLQVALNQFPDTYIAGFTAANKVQNVGSLVAVSLGVAIANYVGQNSGAGKEQRVREGVRNTLWLSLVICAAVSAAMMLFDDPLTALFLDEPSRDIAEIYTASRGYLWASALFFPTLYLLFIYRNALQGMGRPLWPLLAGVLELVVRAVASFRLPALMGWNGVVLVDALAWTSACLLLAVVYYMRRGKGRNAGFIDKR